MLTDIHTHILPSLDDGAKNLDVSGRLLQLEHDNQVGQIALTPHYDCEKMKPADFLRLRDASYRTFSVIAAEKYADIKFKLGAEVYLNRTLPNFDLCPLCIKGTSFLLTELMTTQYPLWVKDVLYQIQLQGITPILAHVERYPHLLQSPQDLYDLVNRGVLVQINANSLLRNDERTKQILRLIKWNLVHVVATDTHSPDKRAPRLYEAMRWIERQAGTQKAEKIARAANAIFENAEPDLAEPHCPQKIFGRYF